MWASSFQTVTKMGKQTGVAVILGSAFLRHKVSQLSSLSGGWKMTVVCGAGVGSLIPQKAGPAISSYDAGFGASPVKALMYS